MNDFEAPGSGSHGPLILLALVFAVALGAALLSLGMVDKITENKATTAQQATLQEEARSKAIIEEARAQADAIIAQAKADAEIQREREIAHTERWQSFLVAMNSAKADVGTLLASVFMIAMVVVMWLIDRKERR